MKTYYLIAGSLCILYYLTLILYSKRLKVTFAGFWLIMGGVHLLCGCAPFPFLRGSIASLTVCLGWIIFLIVEAGVFRGMTAKAYSPCDYVIVLGAQVRGTRITDSLRRRLEKAYDYLVRFPQAQVIVSGGQGPGEDISEAEAMARWLQEQGIRKSRIILEDRSTSTRENFRFSRKYMKKTDPAVLIVTNGFHLYRASLLAQSEGFKKIRLLAASSNPVFLPNYLVREFFALIAFAVRELKNKKDKNDFAKE